MHLPLYRIGGESCCGGYARVVCKLSYSQRSFRRLVCYNVDNGIWLSPGVFS